MNTSIKTHIDATPLIIIGAGRSGTNMLRDVLTSIDGVSTWPCDEINYIWRHGNKRFVSDELTVDHASYPVMKFIRDEFSKFIETSELRTRPKNSRIIVEKTCANSLRVPFVDAVLPEAKYIHIVRDGRDVVSSAMKRWKAPLDIPYLLAKARYVPKSDLPYYAVNYFKNRLFKIFSGQSSLAIWGPKFNDMPTAGEVSNLAEICGLQWVKCVELSCDALNSLPSNKSLYIRYEDFIESPENNVKEILEFVSFKYDPEDISAACRIVRSDSVGRGRREGNVDISNAELVMADTLVKHGYS